MVLVFKIVFITILQFFDKSHQLMPGAIDMYQHSADGTGVDSMDEDNRPRFDNLPRPIKRNHRKKEKPESIHWRWPLLILALGCLLFYCVYLIDYILPDAVSMQESIQNPHIFSAERSMQISKKFANIGKRIVGSAENEQVTPGLIVDEIQNIMDLAHPNQSIAYEVKEMALAVQKGEGSFEIGSRVNVYQNIKNVIAVLKGYNGTHGVMLNCHYDTVTSSPGASDNAINCAVMLELLRVLSRRSERFKHNIVFLFNGAEEIGLMAAHLALQHKWVKDLDVFINLEAAGLGGRAIIFQSGPENTWLLKHYANRAPHPHGQVMAEELFQGGFVPSDTDFRIFRDFGNMSGLDIAFARNGYVYHTIYDKDEYISGGCHQHMGDNVLEVLKVLGDAEELNDIQGNKGGTMVFFDYLGWFFVSYSNDAGIAINIIITFFSVVSVFLFMGRLLNREWLPKSMGPLDKIKYQRFMMKFRSSKNSNNAFDLSPTNQNRMDDEDFRISQDIHADSTTELWSRNNKSLSWCALFLEIAMSIGVRLLSMVLTFGVCALMALFIDGVAPLSMPYYSNVHLIFFYYWCPGLAAYALLPLLFDKFREKRKPLSITARSQLNIVAMHIIWTLLLFILTCMNIRTAVIILVPVLFTTIGFFIIFLTPLYKTVYSWIWVHIVAGLPALFYQFYVSLMMYMLFIPITGRSGPINGDMYVAIVTALLMIYVVSFVMPLMTVVRKPWVVLCILMCVSLFTLSVTLPTDLGHPYRKGPNNPTPQRYTVSNLERKFYNETGGLFRYDWGYLINSWDRNSPRTIPYHLKQEIISIENDCVPGMEMYCHRMQRSGFHWIPTPEPPTLPTITEIILYGKSWTNDRSIYDFAFKGPDRMTIVFSPRKGVVLNSWSLPAPHVAASGLDGRPIYTIRVVRGEVTNDFLLRLNFNITDGIATRPLVDILLHGFHVHHEDEYTPMFVNFLDEFPDFVTMTSEIGSHISAVY